MNFMDWLCFFVIAMYFQLLFGQIYLLSERLKIQQLQEKEQINMIADEQRTLQLLQPLIKIIKDRQLLYFEALSFATKNIESTSTEIDQILIFNKFLNSTAETESQIVARQTRIFSQVGPNEDLSSDGYKVVSTSKYEFIYNRQMMRISTRVLEMLDASVDKAKNSLFGQNGKLGIDFTKFKKSLHRTIRQQTIDLVDFTGVIINFVKNKYRRQISRVRNYLNRLQAGEHVSLKDLFIFEGSDASASPDDKPFRQNIKSFRPHKKLTKDFTPQHESHLKKSSTRKISQSKTKKTVNLKTTRMQQMQEPVWKQKDRKMQKSATAALLLKFYSVMDLNKKQFLQDYVFQAHQEEKQRKRLMTELLERNNKNSEFIRQYYFKCQNIDPLKLQLTAPNHHSSDQNINSSVYRNDSSANSRASMRTSFVISKRKGSFVLETPSDRSDAQHSVNHGKLPFSRTIKNFSPASRKIVDQKKEMSSMRPKRSTNSKKLFVIKTPMTFDDEIIPKADMANVAWIQTPLTGRDKQKSRRNEHIRIKKRNNPVPLDEKYLPESFRITQYPI